MCISICFITIAALVGSPTSDIIFNWAVTKTLRLCSVQLNREYFISHDIRIPSLPSLKLTAKAPENGWLEYKPFLLGRPGLFSGAKWLLVSGRGAPNRIQWKRTNLSWGFSIALLPSSLWSCWCVSLRMAKTSSVARTKNTKNKTIFCRSSQHSFIQHEMYCCYGSIFYTIARKQWMLGLLVLRQNGYTFIKYR